MGKSKDIGTRAETAVVRYLHSIGYTRAQRLPLAGADIGDITLGDYGVMLQVKSGSTAEQASDQKILSWLSEAQVQAVHGKWSGFFLVTKRKGFGLTGGRVGGWWLHWFHGEVPVRTQLEYLPSVIDTE